MVEKDPSTPSSYLIMTICVNNPRIVIGVCIFVFIETTMTSVALDILSLSFENLVTDIRLLACPLSFWNF